MHIRAVVELVLANSFTGEFYVNGHNVTNDVKLCFRQLRDFWQQDSQLQAELAAYKRMMDATPLIHIRGFNEGISQRQGKWHIWDAKSGEHSVREFGSAIEAFENLEKRK